MNDVAVQSYEQALNASKKLREYQFEIEATWNLASGYRQQGQLLTAMTLYEKALDLSRIKEDREKEDVCLDLLNDTLLDIATETESKDDFASSIPHYDKCLELLKGKDKDLKGTLACQVLYRLGRARFKTGDLPESIKVFPNDSGS
jgi:tetratricopeptide (TPR) repeat protein